MHKAVIPVTCFHCRDDNQYQELQPLVFDGGRADILNEPRGNGNVV